MQQDLKDFQGKKVKVKMELNVQQFETTINNSIIQKVWYKNSKYVHLWLHLLLKATHKQHEFMWNKEIINS